LFINIFPLNNCLFFDIILPDLISSINNKSDEYCYIPGNNLLNMLFLVDISPLLSNLTLGYIVFLIIYSFALFYVLLL